MGRKIRGLARFIWINIAVAVLVLTVAEAFAAGYLALRERRREAGRVTELAERYDVGPDQGWVPDYVREVHEAREGEWHSYVYWRRKPYRGKYLNIDKAGIRRTWNNTTSPRPDQLRVWMFGGSTLWGVGARDDFTIPSLVSKKLAAQVESGAWVTSFAEIGYVSTQEVIVLMLELRRGTPDLVVFFDGVNDAFAAFQSGVAGIPQNESHRVAEFDSLKRVNWRQMIIEKLALYKLAAGFARSRGAPLVRVPRTDDALAREVVDVYRWNVGFVNAVAQRYGFRVVFLWQPTVYTKKHLSTRERQWYEQLGRKFARTQTTRPVLDKVYGAFRESVRTSRIDNVYDLSGVFDEAPTTMFIDEWHTTEAGNEMIAEAIIPTLLPESGR